MAVRQQSKGTPATAENSTAVGTPATGETAATARMHAAPGVPASQDRKQHQGTQF